ncbi:fkbp-type peptidyl-prolyl cis-trans isomerase [Trichococcus palustris]|jgi:trigger factor|uniref:Trigger factor n=1 Tax=Trichococcus palustris TaxID=140314 RepID=A0A143YB10_9LACT|nr:trigger factor [Trichococcus palustris]CZQ84820.1 fkbp-type peptidyl-prolyl cis-trans isomerase [Trichococcus palustris]SFK54067.1 trigger factor [Trichococcus palustris]
MTANWEKTGTNDGVLTFEISEEIIKKEIEKVFNRVKKNISVPGFRKGKVPRHIFNNVYGEESLFEDALNEALPTAYAQAIEEAGIDPVSQPKIDIKSMEKGQPWTITAEVTVKPEVKLGEYKNLTVAKQDREVTDEDVENNLKQKQERQAELVLKEEGAELGDTVVIDYEGFVAEEAFEGGKDQNHSLELGSNQFIPGFEEQLVGAKAGDEKEVVVTFPEDYQAEDLKGKEATFKVAVHEVKTKQLPALDDEFAKDVDEEVETLDELKAKIRKELEESKKAAADEAVQDLALRQAVENAEIVELPHVMVHDEVHRQMDLFLNDMQRQGISPELYYQITGTTEHDLHVQMESDADVRTKTSLVLEQIIKEENIEVSEAEIAEEIKALAEQYNMDETRVRGLVNDEMLKNDIQMKKAMSVITDSAIEA